MLIKLMTTTGEPVLINTTQIISIEACGEKDIEIRLASEGLKYRIAIDFQEFCGLYNSFIYQVRWENGWSQ